MNGLIFKQDKILVCVVQDLQEIRLEYANYVTRLLIVTERTMLQIRFFAHKILKL